MCRSENISLDICGKDIKDFKTTIKNSYLVDLRSINSVGITTVW